MKYFKLYKKNDLLNYYIDVYDDNDILICVYHISKGVRHKYCDGFNKTYSHMINKLTHNEIYVELSEKEAFVEML